MAQEDSHEFLRCMLERLGHVSAKAAGVPERCRDRRDETTPFHALFGGYFRNQVRCTECGFASNTFDAFQDLSLEVGNGINTVPQALRHFASVETLDVHNQWKCPACRKAVCARKQMTIRKVRGP
jgi:ubiquitin carboxyl-terminal hydrolase 36/42